MTDMASFSLQPLALHVDISLKFLKSTIQK